MIYDFVVIGAGIVGMSTAWQLQRAFPGRSIVVLEKEPRPACHQTGHNSGVIHAGVYYAPGSLKAEFCKQGNSATKNFCREYGIDFEECGKLLVATDALELERMKELVGLCGQNGIAVETWTAEELREREPNISGMGAILVPSTGIVNYTLITDTMAELVREAGGELQVNAEVTAIDEHRDTISIHTGKGAFTGRFLIACAGLMSDRIVAMMGVAPGFKIIPFRGEYFRLTPGHNDIVRHLIYPIPDRKLPFLGVHLTRMIDGTVTVGPNAVLAFKREGYRKTDFSFGDCVEMFTYPGLLRVLYRHFGVSVTELKNSLWVRGYLNQVQKYCPGLSLKDLQPYPSGVRAQAVTPRGELVNDFLFVTTRRALAVCNAPSPAATSALPIGNHIVEKVRGLAAII